MRQLDSMGCSLLRKHLQVAFFVATGNSHEFEFHTMQALPLNNKGTRKTSMFLNKCFQWKQISRNFSQMSIRTLCGERIFSFSFLHVYIILFRSKIFVISQDKSKNAELRKTLPQMEQFSGKLEFSIWRTQKWPRLYKCHSLCVLLCRNWIKISQNKTSLKS